MRSALSVVGVLTVSALASAAGCVSADDAATESTDTSAISGEAYHCVVTGEDPEGPAIYLDLTASKAYLSHEASFHTRYTGALDTSYKPRDRVNMVRFLGYADWVPHGTTKLYVDKSLQTDGGEGDIFVDMVTTKFTEVVYSCSPS